MTCSCELYEHCAQCDPSFFAARDLTPLERAQGKLIRDLVRETECQPHEKRDDGQILFIVRRLLSPSSQQTYLDEAQREAGIQKDNGNG